MKRGYASFIILFHITAAVTYNFAAKVLFIFYTETIIYTGLVKNFSYMFIYVYVYLYIFYIYKIYIYSIYIKFFTKGCPKNFRNGQIFRN